MNSTESSPHNPEGQEGNLKALGIFAVAISYIGSVLKYYLQQTLSIKDGKNLTQLEKKLGFLGAKFPLHGNNRRGY